MEKKWIDLILGPGGALVISIAILFFMFQYFTEMQAEHRLESKQDREKYYVLLEKNIKYMAANTHTMEGLVTIIDEKIEPKSCNGPTKIVKNGD
jgi:hypothetical protein